MGRVEKNSRVHPKQAPAKTSYPKKAFNKDVVLSHLNRIAVKFVKQLAFEQDIPIPSLKNPEYVRSFGSYGLGIDDSASDLDAVFIAPNFVKREDFFKRFVQELKAIPARSIHDICPIELAYVPVIKFWWSDIRVDLTFASLKQPCVPSDDDVLLSNATVVDLDEDSLRSINGWRVCRFLLKYVPNQTVFKQLLSTVKEWAVAQQIYSNSCGYLGGVSWAILVAKTCKDHKGASMEKLLQIFFETYGHKWDWSKKHVTLNENRAQDCVPVLNGRGGDRMMIITPCYPFQISSFNVTSASFDRIIRSMRRALAILKQGIQLGFAPRVAAKLLTAPFDPLTEYEEFIILEAEVDNGKKLRRWTGCAESKFPSILRELLSDPLMKRVEIFPKINHEIPSNGKPSASWVMGVDHAKGIRYHTIWKTLEGRKKSIYDHSDRCAYRASVRGLEDPFGKERRFGFYARPKQELIKMLHAQQ